MSSKISLGDQLCFDGVHRPPLQPLPKPKGGR